MNAGTSMVLSALSLAAITFAPKALLYGARWLGILPPGRRPPTADPELAPTEATRPVGGRTRATAAEGPATPPPSRPQRRDRVAAHAWGPPSTDAGGRSTRACTDVGCSVRWIDGDLESGR